MGDVIEAAQRLGITPKEAAERVVASVDVAAFSDLRREEKAYQIARAFKAAARALA